MTKFKFRKNVILSRIFPIFLPSFDDVIAREREAEEEMEEEKLIVRE